LRSAGRELRLAFNQPLNALSRERFLRVWNGVAYLFPGLHPDGFEAADSGWPREIASWSELPGASAFISRGWPRVVQRFAAEAWRRVETGELSEEELYPSDASWCGLYDRMHTHKPDETDRRLALAADYGEAL
jgi:hypothetical protein